MVLAYSDYFMYNNLFVLENNTSSTISYFFQTPDNILLDYINYYSYFFISLMVI